MISNKLLAGCLYYHVHAACSFPSKLSHLHYFWLKYHKQKHRILKVTLVSYFKPELMLLCTMIMLDMCALYVLITRIFGTCVRLFVR